MEKEMNYEDTCVDIVIIGSGLAAGAAGFRAAGNGRKVLILEKMDYFGGNSVLAGGGYASSDSCLKYREKFNLEPDSWEIHKEDTLKAGSYKNDPELVEVMAKGAPEGLDWLISCGVTFTDALNMIGGHSVHRAYMANITGKQIMDKVIDAAKAKGAVYLNRARVTELLKEDGRVTGLKYEHEGNIVTVKASLGVIIASGGFSRDEKLRAKYCPSIDERYSCSNHKGATGEMIEAAVGIGADTVGMEYIQLYPCADPKSGSIDTCGFHAYTGAGYGMVYINSEGKRFVNELLGRDKVSDAQINGCSKPTYAVFNKEMADILGLSDKETELFCEMKRLYTAETIKELAEKLGIDAKAMSETVLKHNEFIKGIRKDEFGKEKGSTFHMLENGPFMAIPQWPTVHFTMGGIRIDTDARVLDKDKKPIPGLYAAGEVTGGVHGTNRLGGNALAECVVFGFIAGETR